MKTRPPAVATNLLSRPRLEDLVERVAAAPVTVVRAAGGFGKTTLLRAWASRLEERGVTIVWLSLDPHDASVNGLAGALNASLRAALKGFGQSAQRLLDEGIEQPARLMAALSNELIAWIDEHVRSVCVFIDDVQFVVDEGNALEVLAEFVRAVPAEAHVVLASRASLKFAPLGKLRAGGLLAEISEDDLRFTLDEAAALLPDQQTAAEFIDQTEGWPIALGLGARIASADPAAWKRAIATSKESIFDFLAEEVLERLPPTLREHAFACAIPPVVDEIYSGGLLGGADFNTVIIELLDFGLYLSRVGDGSWRFHHLFRDFLLERFRRSSPDRLRALRLEYASRLRANGFELEALAQVLDAQEYGRIVDFVQGALQTIRFTEGYKTFVRLLSRVPQDVMETYPMLHRFYGTALVRDGRFEEALEQFHACYERALSTGDIATACAAQMELGLFSDRSHFLRHGRFEKSEQHFRRALELAESPELADRPVARGIAHWMLGTSLACRSAFDEAFVHFSQAEKIERASSRHVDNVLVEIAVAYGWMGNWTRALEYAELAEELFRIGGGEVQIGRALRGQAQAHLALHPASTRCLEAASAAAAALAKDQPDELPAALVLVARAHLNNTPPALEPARRALEDAAARLDVSYSPVAAFDLAVTQAEAALLAGEPAGARAHIARANTIAVSLDEPWQAAMVGFMRGLTFIVERDDSAAELEFEAARAAFSRLGDRFYHALSLLSAHACRVRSGTIDPARVSELFSFIRAERLEYVCASAPRSSMTLLVWCLVNDVMVEVAEALFSQTLSADTGPLLEVALDTQISSASRACALRLIAKTDPGGARSTVKALCLDADPLVAGTARATLDYLPSPDVPPMWVSVVGELQAHFGDVSVAEKDERWGRKRASELLRFLAIARAPVTKGAVINALWPETDSVSDTTLRVTLHLLRRALQPDADGAGDYVFYDGTTMRLNADVFETTDAEQADASLRRADLLLARHEYAEARDWFNAAVSVYSNAPREEDVAEWLQPHVRHWRDQCLRALYGLAKLEREEGNTEAALRTARRALAFDPLHEESVCLALDLYIALGDMEAGRGVFATYKRRLSEQLDAGPSPAVLDRYTKIVQRSKPSVTDSVLSAREREVLGLVARGLSNKQIGAELDLSTWTINNHVAKILKKLKVESRTAAAALAGSD